MMLIIIIIVIELLIRNTKIIATRPRLARKHYTASELRQAQVAKVQDFKCKMQVHGVKCMESSASCKCKGVKSKLQVQGVKCKESSARR